MTMKIKSLLIINTKEMKSLCVNNVLSFKEFKPLQKGLFSFTSMKKNATLTGPLLISGNKFSTFTFKSSCANIVKRFMMSSSGGRNPKLPASPPSEKKTPSSMYSQKDLENGAEGCKVPLLDLYTPSTTPYSFKQPSGSASIPTVASANSNSQINATKTSADNALKNVRDHLPQIPSVPTSVIEQKVQPSSPIKAKVSFGLGHVAYANLQQKDLAQSGKPYTTIITEATTIAKLSPEQLLVEMKNRELIREVDNKSAILIKLQDDSSYLLGSSKNNVKLSVVGLAYYEAISSKKECFDFNVQENINSLQESNLMIIVPPKSTDNIFIDTGIQKHLLVIYNSATDKYFAVGYLTSKKGTEFFSPQQFKAFQDQQENSPSKSHKQQYFKGLENPIQIKKEDIKRAKWDKEYIQSLPTNTYKEMITSLWADLKEKKFQIFENAGLTMEDGIRMCQQYDTIVRNKSKHPLTAKQIQLNEENKQKQLKNLKKKITGDHDENPF